MIHYLLIWLREILARRKYRQACEEYLRVGEQIRRLRRYQRQVIANQQALAWREWQDVRAHSEDAFGQLIDHPTQVKLFSFLTGSRR
jgi:hypothetical protein